MANVISDTENVASAPSAIPIMRRGLVIAGILLIAANLRASITVVGPLLGEVRTDLDISSTTASALISLPLLCFAVFSPLPRSSQLGGEWNGHSQQHSACSP
ncbi:hypothetical protein ACETU7_18660 [Rhodococcus sp. 3Y1]